MRKRNPVKERELFVEGDWGEVSVVVRVSPVEREVAFELVRVVRLCDVHVSGTTGLMSATSVGAVVLAASGFAVFLSVPSVPYRRRTPVSYRAVRIDELGVVWEGVEVVCVDGR